MLQVSLKEDIILIFGSWILILERLDTTDQIIKSVDLQKIVPRALCLLSVFCILSKRSVLVNPPPFPCRCTHNPITDKKRCVHGAGVPI